MSIGKCVSLRMPSDALPSDAPSDASTDERVWKDFIPIPGEQEFHNKLEETLELIGHIAIGCALLFAIKKPTENPAGTKSGKSTPI